MLDLLGSAALTEQKFVPVMFILLYKGTETPVLQDN